MATNHQIGDPLALPDGTTVTVNVESCGHDEPDCITLDGYAVLMHLDPGTVDGRALIEDLRQRLTDAVDFHTAWVEEHIGRLKVGDDLGGVRLAGENEEQCTFPFVGALCGRPRHVDGHHVAVDANYEVVAVAHEGAVG